MVAPEHLAELQLASPSAAELMDGGRTYVHLPGLALPAGCAPSQVDALLCLSEHSGYSTRLFLTHPIPARGANWTAHVILGKTWHTWSWNHVPVGLRPMEILAEHLRGLR